MTRKLTIGQLAKQAKVNIETIRYYQRVDLIQEPKKPENGYRIYNNAQIDRIRFIKRAQQLGFALAEIKELLKLGEGHCSDVRDLAQEKRDKIQQQISDLTAMRQELDNLINACHLTESTSHCALIDTLAQTKKLN